MESNILQQEDQTDPQAPCQLLVTPLGFEDVVVERLRKIFQRERPGERTYTVVYPYAGEKVDIFLVNYDDAGAVKEKNALLSSQCPTARVVAASHGPLMNETVPYHLHPYQVHGMLLAARLLNVFDKIPSNPLAPDVVVTTAKERDDASSIEALKASGGCSVLVVDDSPSVQKSIEINLRTLEQITQIDFADDGEKALEKVDTKQYDIIFLDVMMPGIDGYETCTRIRKKSQYKHTPIVMVSAKCSPLDEVKGIIAGCTTYLTKPVQDDAFQKLSRRMVVWMAGQKTSQ